MKGYCYRRLFAAHLRLPQGKLVVTDFVALIGQAKDAVRLAADLSVEGFHLLLFADSLAHSRTIFSVS